MSTGAAVQPIIPTESTASERNSESIVGPRVRGLALAVSTALRTVSAPADPEALHQFRVAIRRLEAALDLIRSRPPDEFQTERDCLRWAFRSVGGPRDLDVQLAILEKYRSSMSESEHEDFEPVIGWFERRRGPVRSAMHRKLRSRRLEQVLESLTQTISESESNSNDTSSQSPVELARAIMLRGERLDRSVRSLRRQSKAERFHRARVRAKRVRYAIEAYSDVLPKRARKYLASASAIQSMLGDEHDAIVLADKLDEIAAHYEYHWPPATHQLILRVQRDLRKRAARTRRKFLRDQAKTATESWRRTRKALRHTVAGKGSPNLEATTNPSRSGGTAKLITLAG